MHRRQFLRRLGAVGGGLALAAPAAADIESDAKPSSVTIDYDADWVQRYAPALRMSLRADRNMTGVYGYRARSENEDYAVAAYWVRYAVQDAISPLDSHQYDHEPVYVKVDSGDVTKIVYSGYHHFAADALAADLSFRSGNHASLDVIAPWHHYRRLDRLSGTVPDVRDWTAARDEWQAYGFYDRTANEAVDNPYTMVGGSRNSWWERDTLDYWGGRVFAQLGVRGADQRDQLRFEVG